MKIESVMEIELDPEVELIAKALFACTNSNPPTPMIDLVWPPPGFRRAALKSYLNRAHYIRDVLKAEGGGQVHDPPAQYDEAEAATPEGKPYDEAESITAIWVTDVDDREQLYAMIRAYGDRRASEMREAITDKAREYAGHYATGSDARNTFIILAEWAEALLLSPDPKRGDVE